MTATCSSHSAALTLTLLLTGLFMLGTSGGSVAGAFISLATLVLNPAIFVALLLDAIHRRVTIASLTALLVSALTIVLWMWMFWALVHEHKQLQTNIQVA
jgi:predicted branched-subunit amino acid permease